MPTNVPSTSTIRDSSIGLLPLFGCGQGRNLCPAGCPPAVLVSAAPHARHRGMDVTSTDAAHSHGWLAHGRSP
ncbi:hypothetical protein SXCC_02140 [Gluconacetobacter sp. SXCC-1]|nr:hypothetical protein SXCC_02140 [Gluconacetobacter sp. SXCC-1]